MNVHITGAYPQPDKTFLPLFRELAESDRFQEHSLTDDSDHADIILFVDANMHPHDVGLSAIRNHRLVREYRDKVFLYNELDQPWCTLPGLYVSMPKSSFNCERQRASAYVLNVLNPFVHRIHKDCIQPDLLFSFIGRRCTDLRSELLQLEHPLANISDSTEFDFFDYGKRDLSSAQERYAEIMARSKFVLCPRGSGPSSFRLFETMCAGRVPVIISDEWVPPSGPDWDSCSIRVKESNVGQIPALMDEVAGHYSSLAENARREWENWFGPDVLFHRMIESCCDIARSRKYSENLLCHIPDLRHLRLRLRGAKAHFNTMATGSA